MTVPVSPSMPNQYGFEAPMAGRCRPFVAGVVLSMTIGPPHAFRCRTHRQGKDSSCSAVCDFGGHIGGKQCLWLIAR